MVWWTTGAISASHQPPPPPPHPGTGPKGWPGRAPRGRLDAACVCRHVERVERGREVGQQVDKFGGGHRLEQAPGAVEALNCAAKGLGGGGGQEQARPSPRLGPYCPRDHVPPPKLRRGGNGGRVVGGVKVSPHPS